MRSTVDLVIQSDLECSTCNCRNRIFYVEFVLQSVINVWSVQ